MARNKSEGVRGRSPGPAADRRESSLSELSIQDHDAIDAMQSSAPPRTSKRRKRSELSPSSKATHSIIEKERREAMNEKFSELAANIPELVEAIAAGKRPTKGEIVKASIARHQDQERRVAELMHEVQMLRAGRDAATPSSSSFPRIETPSPVNTTVHEQMMPPTQALSLPYQIQASHPVGLPGTDAHDNLWIGQLFDKTHQQLSFDAPQPLPLLPDMMQQPVSPFKQTSMMNWNLSSLPQPLDAASFGMGIPASGILKGFMDNGMLANLARRDSVASGPTATSGFSSPTFTSSSDSDSTFSSEAVDPSLDERKFLADSMSFEPFAMPTSLPEQTPLTSLVGLPATADLLNANNQARRVTAHRRARKDGVKEEAVQLSSSPLTASLVANT